MRLRAREIGRALFQTACRIAQARQTFRARWFFVCVLFASSLCRFGGLAHPCWFALYIKRPGKRLPALRENRKITLATSQERAAAVIAPAPEFPARNAPAETPACEHPLALAAPHHSRPGARRRHR